MRSGWRDCASSSSPSNPARRNCCNGSGRCCLPARTAWYIYGCTEINDMTYCDPAEQHSGSGFVPVGRPIANTKVHVLDEQLRPLPPGIMGEVHIESLGIAHGYWRQGGLTAARFIANPYGPPGSRLYRTG
ncbi:AMP-binding protein, partial [Xanthomonas sp. MUS 060]|uniref:AMP-binding protein n=1 Tax=Xanthomonas sp. MUS 060 TaxID=1588031 RepID=UPI0021007ECC